MKKALVILLSFLMAGCVTFGTPRKTPIGEIREQTKQSLDSKITALTELTAIDGSDILYVIDDPAGTPTSKKITALNLFDLIDTAAELETVANLGAYASDFLAATSEANFKSITNLEAGTDYNAYSAALNSISGLTETNGGIPYGTADNAYAWLAAGATGKVLIAKGAAAPEWTPYTFPATVPTVGKVLISDGTNLIGSTALGTGAYATIGDYAPLASPALTGSPTVGTSIDPDTADGATLGSATKEWSDIFLAASGVIYGENDQSNTFTSSATGWTANLNLAAATYGSDGSVTDAELLYVDTTSSIQTQLDARALESVVGTSLNADDLVNTGGVLELQPEIPHTDANQTISGRWIEYYDVKHPWTSAPTASLLRKGTTIKVAVASYDPVGFGGTVNYETTITEDVTELMPNQVDRDFSGASAWANVDVNAYDETTDLTLTASAADQYCTLAVLSAPTTSASYYAIHFDVANLVGTWTVKDFDGTNTIGTISANGTDQYIIFVADDSNGGLRLVANETTSSGDFDNFSLTKQTWKIDRDDAGNTYSDADQSVPNGITDADGRVLTAAEMNSVIVATGAGDIDIPENQCDTATFKWLCVQQTGVFLVSLTSNDAADVFTTSDGVELDIGDELDLAGADNSQVCVMCLEVNKWRITGEIGTAVDGGAAD